MHKATKGEYKTPDKRVIPRFEPLGVNCLLGKNRRGLRMAAAVTGVSQGQSPGLIVVWAIGPGKMRKRSEG